LAKTFFGANVVFEWEGLLTLYHLLTLPERTAEMKLNFLAPAHTIQFSDRIPEKLKPHAIREANREVATGPFGFMLFQHIDTPTFAIRYHCYFINETNRLELFSDKEILELFFNLDTPLDFHLDGIGNLHFSKNAYNLMYLPCVKGTLSFQKNQNYKLFSIRMRIDYLDSFTRYFPEIAEMQQKIKNRQPGILYTMNPVAPRELLLSIKEVLHCNYSDKLLKIFLDAKLLTILVSSLEKNAVSKQQVDATLRKIDIVQIEAIRQLLLENVHITYTLAQLAIIAGMSETRLSKGFLKTVGKTWFTFQLDARLAKAKELLLSTEDSADAIGAEVGYQSPHSFSKAFKKHYGLSPTHYRKKYGRA
jgi:AraC-like DNA-binding protein